MKKKVDRTHMRDWGIKRTGKGRYIIIDTVNGKISLDIIQGFICGDDRPLRVEKGQSFVDYALELLNKQYMRRKIKNSTYKNSVSYLSCGRGIITLR